MFSSRSLIRCARLLGAALLLSACASTAPLEKQTVVLTTGAKGGGFLDYGNALAQTLKPVSPFDLQVRETAGTAENIRLLQAGQSPFALVVMGPALDAWNGQGAWKDKPAKEMRALAPMYDTSFHFIARADAGISSLRQLQGKKLGIGPAKGTAEGFVRGLLDATGVVPVLVNGTPAEHVKQLQEGSIDAIWFGAGLPIPAFAQAAKAMPTRSFGLTADEQKVFIARFPYFAPSVVPANTYPGQTEPLQSVAVWNFIVAHADVPDRVAYEFVRSVFANADKLRKTYDAARGTQPNNAGANTFMTFHPGAVRYYRENNVELNPRVVAR